MEIEAIMCDVDGTLLTSDHVVSPKTIEAIRKAREKGILFGLSTGRDVNSVKELLKPWGIDGLVDSIVGTGGAEIYDYVLNVSKQEYPLDGELIIEIIDHFKDLDCNFVIPWEGILYAPKDDRHIKALAEGDGVPYKVTDFKKFLKTPKPKVMITCDPEMMSTIVERAKTFKNDQYKSSSLITASTLYEYMDPRVTKSHGLQEVMGMHHIPMEHLCTFGDADNDYDMTLSAGVGVIMGNGSEKCKAVADYITDDNNHDGIAHFINQYILK